MISPDVHSEFLLINLLIFLDRVAVKESRNDYRNERELVEMRDIPIVTPLALAPSAYSYV